MMKIQYSFA